MGAAVHAVGSAGVRGLEDAAFPALARPLLLRPCEVVGMVATYRFDDEVLRHQVSELLVERRREVRALDRVARDVVVRRTARAAAGAVGIAGGLGLLGVTAVDLLAGWNGLFSARPDTHGVLTELLLGAWGAMAIAYGLGRLAGHALYGRALGRAPELSGRPRVDLARLQGAHPRDAVTALLGRLQVPSVGGFLAGLGLLLPLTIHLAFWIVAPGGSALAHWRDFDGWIQLSVFAVGIAHLALAVCLVRLARTLAARREALSRKAAFMEGLTILLVTFLAAFVPGVVLMAIPPILTVVTGLLFLPFMVSWAIHTLASERETLAYLGA